MTTLQIESKTESKEMNLQEVKRKILEKMSFSDIVQSLDVECINVFIFDGKVPFIENPPTEQYVGWGHDVIEKMLPIEDVANLKICYLPPLFYGEKEEMYGYIFFTK